MTGNTRRVGEAIFSEIQGEKDIKPLEEITGLACYDLIFIGFPVLRFGPPRCIRTFLWKYAKEKNIALFVTHASWYSPDLTPDIETWLSKCKAAATGSNLVGFFDCQGELSESSARLFLKSEFPEIRHFGSLRSMTIGHPNAVDLDNARIFARTVQEKMNK